MNYEELTNILIEILLTNYRNSNNSVGVIDFLKVVTPVFSTLIAFALGYLQSERALIKSKKIDCKEKEIETSNKLVFQVLAAHKEITYFRDRFKNLIDEETDPIQRVFRTRVWSPPTKKITIEHFELGFLNKFEKSVSEKMFGLSSCNDVCTLLDNINILFKSLEQRNEVAKSAHKIVSENSDGLAPKSIEMAVDVHSLWLWVYTNEQFLNSLDRVYYACIDFITSYPKVASYYFKHDKLKTGVDPLENASFSMKEIKPQLPIPAPIWKKTLDVIKVSEKEVIDQFNKSSYEKYVVECEEYLKKFANR